MRRYLPLICFLLFAVALNAQQETLRFKKYSIDDGMLQSTVNATLQDSRGFVWFATQVGLNRFDGNTFKAYKNIPGDSTSLSNNWIWMISEDSQQRLWIGTFHGGLNQYRHATDDFLRYHYVENDTITLSNTAAWSILERPDGKLWVGFDKDIALLDPEKKSFYHIDLPGGNHHGFSLDEDRDGNIWIASTLGIFQMHPASHELTYYPFFPETPDRSSGTITRMLLDREQRVWFGTNEGVYLLDVSDVHPKYRTLSSYLEKKNYSFKSPQFITYMARSNNSSFWIGTRDGLYQTTIGKSADEISAKYVTHDKTRPGSLSHNYILSAYENKAEDLWIGTRNGVNYSHPAMRKFKHVPPRPSTPGGLNHPNIMTIMEDSDKNLWVGTYGGVNLLNKKTNKYRVFNHSSSSPTSLPYDYVLIIREDHLGNLWIGTNGGGIARLNPEERKRAASGRQPRFLSYRSINSDTTSPASNVIYAIYQAPDSSLWFGHAGGISLYNYSEDKFQRFADETNTRGLVHRHVYNLLIDRQGRFWAATANGLNLFNSETQLFEPHFHDPKNKMSLNSSFIVSLFESKAGELWVTTSTGLNKLLRETGKKGELQFQRISVQDGLPDGFVYCMLEDQSGNLWVSANKGLTRITISDSLPKMLSYSVEDGLQSNEFSQNAAYLAKDGRMYFGGINGYNVFHPDSIQNDETPPNIALTDFKILNESVATSINGETPLNSPINETDKIELSYRDDVISFEFSALSYASPHKNHYAYKMEGFDHDWIMSGNRRFATYTNLDPGDYTFRVKGSNSDNIWNEEGTTLNITITPPPWKTWWAYLLYSCLCLGLVLSYVQFQIRKERRIREEKIRIQQAKIEERERVRKESSADFHDEAGNIITKIKLFTELARRKSIKDEQLGEYLQKIDEHTKTLSSGMRDFIWVLDPEKDSLYETILRLKDFGNSMYEHSDYHFTTVGPEASMREETLTLLQRRSIILIFKEAMNNCLKYASGKTVVLSAILTHRELMIEFKDDGRGFDAKEKKSGYGLKNMRNRAEKIGAKLDISSENGLGTAVRLSLLLSKNGEVIL
ncbi:MAG: ligand-binding sensor domain-containing protein [Calditrichia bacterium]